MSVIVTPHFGQLTVRDGGGCFADAAFD